LINNNILALWRVRNFAASSQQTTGYNTLRILPALVKTRLERFDGRRQNEHANGVRKMGAYLTRTLPVDFKNDITAGSQGFVHPVAGRTIKVAVYLCPFQQLVVVTKCIELIHTDEAVVLVVLFTWTRGPGSARNGQDNAGVLPQDLVNQTGFTCPAWGDNHNNAAGGRVHV